MEKFPPLPSHRSTLAKTIFIMVSFEISYVSFLVFMGAKKSVPAEVSTYLGLNVRFTEKCIGARHQKSNK
jgi:hypothetical protein